MLDTIGSAYSVQVKVPPVDLPKKLTMMGCWPTVYRADMQPSENTDYTCVVYYDGTHTSTSQVLELMRPYGATSGRWLTDFYREV